MQKAGTKEVAFDEEAEEWDSKCNLLNSEECTKGENGYYCKWRKGDKSELSAYKPGCVAIEGDDLYEEWLDVNDITEKDLTEQEIIDLKQYNKELAASRRSGFNRDGMSDMKLYNTLSCNRGLIEPVKCKKPQEGHWEYPCYDKGKCYRRDCEEDEEGVIPN